MKLFKERLGSIGAHILAFVITLVVIAIPVGLVELTRFIWKPLPDVIWGIFIIGFILFYLGWFIKWLIVEPIKAHRKEKQGITNKE